MGSVSRGVLGTAHSFRKFQLLAEGIIQVVWTKVDARLGFRQFGLERGVIKPPDGRYVDERLMELRL